jgi:DNA repair protein RecO (recombination protein O)
LFARGANGPKSALRGVLRPFQRLLVSWSGKSRPANWWGRRSTAEYPAARAERLMSGFYLNELLLKLTERCDPHPEIFDTYTEAVAALCAGEREEPSLRRFEKRLLDDLGYGLELARTNEGRPVETGKFYRFKLESGPHPCVAEAPGAVYGQSLADLEAEEFGNERSLRDAKRVLRAAIDSCLDGRP